MKKHYLLLLLLNSLIGFSQAGAPAAPYYSGFNWNLTGSALKSALSSKVISTHTHKISYSDLWDASQVTDLDPDDLTNTNVLLIYGYDNTNICPSSTSDVHRRRNKNSHGGAASCEWNREHVYAKNLGTPALQDGGSGSSSDAGEDAHHIRPADVGWNGNRDNEKFVDATGNSRDITADTWYPGDEWKGDVARMMMYMYLRYPSQCLPTNVGVGNAVPTDSNMIDLFLKWNAEDPVSKLEDNRNTYHGNTANTYAQGNRNPFIDNPYLATVIWGGPVAENRWPTTILATEDFDILASVNIYPNPTNDHRINIETTTELDEIQLISVNGQMMQQVKHPKANQNVYTLENLPQGFYFLKLNSDNQTIVKKIVIN